MSELDQTTRMVDDIRTFFDTAEIAEEVHLHIERVEKPLGCEVPGGRSFDDG